MKAECLDSKISFLAQGGMQILKVSIDESVNRRIKQKALSLLQDLLYYDEEIRLVLPKFPNLRANVYKDEEFMERLIKCMS